MHDRSISCTRGAICINYDVIALTDNAMTIDISVDGLTLRCDNVLTVIQFCEW